MASSESVNTVEEAITSSPYHLTWRTAPDDLDGLIERYIALRRQFEEYDSTRLAQYYPGGAYNTDVVRFFPSELRDEAPSAIVKIPHASVSESLPGTLLPLLSALQQQAATIGPIDVLVWGNDKTHLSTPLETYLGRLGTGLIANVELRHLTLDAEINPKLLRISSRFGMQKAPVNFHKLRADAMDWIIQDAYDRRLFPDTPIIWLDSDTPFIDKQTIPKLVDAIESGTTHFAHPNLLLSRSEHGATQFTKWAIPERVAAVYSLARALIEQNLEPTEPRGYNEESGLTMTLSTYLKTGGVPIGSYGTLAAPEDGESKALLSASRLILNPDVPLITYIPGTRLGFSSRRYRELAKYNMPVELPKSEDGPDYQDYTTITSSDSYASNSNANSVPSTASAADLWHMVDYMAERQETRPGTTTRPALTKAQRETLGYIITRFGFSD